MMMDGPGAEPRSGKAACIKGLGTVFFVPAVLFLTLNGFLAALAVDWRSRIQGHWLGRAGRADDAQEGGSRCLYVALVSYILCTVLMYWSYAKAALSDAGVVPIDVGSAQRMWQGLGCGAAAEEEAWTFCESCRRYRPPRSHHCHTCGVCVFRFDHHSMWVNNCIGKCNQRYFVQFLAYLALFLLATGLAPWPGSTDDFAEQELDRWLGPLSALRLPVDYTHAACLVAFPGALGLLLMKLWMMNWGLTAQECTPWMASCCPAHVHDRGPCMNWVDVMGSSPVRWLLPLSPTEAPRPHLDARLKDSV